MAARDRRKPDESLAENLARVRAQILDQQAKAAAADRRRRRLARQLGILPRKERPPSNLDLVKAVFQRKTYNQ